MSSTKSTPDRTLNISAASADDAQSLDAQQQLARMLLEARVPDPVPASRDSTSSSLASYDGSVASGLVSPLILLEPSLLQHSFSQPELYYQSISPPPNSDSTLPNSSAEGPHEVYVHSMHDVIHSSSATPDTLRPHQLSPPPLATQQSTTFEFDSETYGAMKVTHEPTTEQIKATMEQWKEEYRQEQNEQHETETELHDKEGTTEGAVPPTSKQKDDRRPSFHTGQMIDSSDDDDDDDSEDDLPHLTRFELICLCLPAAAVMIGWAVGEALLLPYLLWLGVSPTVANFAFLTNPLLGLFLQPFFGQMSDTCTWQMGRRRPFLLLFTLGSATGLSVVVWSVQLAQFASGGQMGEGSLLQVIFIFCGFAMMDLCHDLLLMPARALLNDRLPDEQTDQGNAFFASISSIGTCVGLALTIAPLDEYYPWSLLGEPVRATFTTATVTILFCNFLALYISRDMDRPYEEDDQIEGEGETTAASPISSEGSIEAAQVAGTESPTESSRLLPAALPLPPPSYGTRVVVRNNVQAPDMSPSDSETSSDSQLDDPDLEKPTPFLCFAENPLNGVREAYQVLPRPLKCIWFLQLVWWYCVLHVNLWWTSWVVRELYGSAHNACIERSNLTLRFVLRWCSRLVSVCLRLLNQHCCSEATPEESADHSSQHSKVEVDPDYAVRLATIGLLVQAIVSFPASAALPVANRWFGVTNYYHMSAILYGLAAVSIGWVTMYYQSLIVMAVLGVAIPPIFSSSYLLVEIYAAEADSEDDDSESESDVEGPPHRTPPNFNSTVGFEGGESTEGDGPDSAKHRFIKSSTSSRRSSVIHTSDSASEEEAEFTTETLEEKRGTITALFNVTMILSQLVVGLFSGLLIQWTDNITFVFLMSGALLVASNVVVLFFRLSKPELPEEDEEEETVEATILEEARKQQIRKLEKLDRAPPTLHGAHPPKSPPLRKFKQEFESIPTTIAVAPAMGGEYVRPLALGGGGGSRKQSHQSQSRSLKRSLSAPDVHLAMRALRKSRAKAAAKHSVKVPLFQPHGVNVVRRRELLKGARPRSKNVRVFDSDASSASIESDRQRMRDAHNLRLEKVRVDKLRERARLFGLKVAMRVAQLKATRDKHRKAGNVHVHHRHPSSARAVFRAFDGEEHKSSQIPLATASSSSSSSYPPATGNSHVSRITWSMLGDAPVDGGSVVSETEQFLPYRTDLPAINSVEEERLINQLALQSLESQDRKEQEALAAQLAAQSKQDGNVNQPRG